MYLAESESAEKLLSLLWDGQKQKLSKDKIDAALVEAEKRQKLELSKEQKNAVSYALTETVSIITGGPGTGKTSLLQVLICAEEMLHPEGKLTLCAPTGRAARKWRRVLEKSQSRCIICLKSVRRSRNVRRKRN